MNKTQKYIIERRRITSVWFCVPRYARACTLKCSLIICADTKWSESGTFFFLLLLEWDICVMRHQMIPTLQYQCLAAYLRFTTLPFCSRNMPSARQRIWISFYWQWDRNLISVWMMLFVMKVSITSWSKAPRNRWLVSLIIWPDERFINCARVIKLRSAVV